MPDRTDIHVNVGDYLLGRLGDGEHARVRAHLSECESCGSAVVELEDTAALLHRAAPQAALPADLEERTLQAVRDAAGSKAPPAPAPRRRPFAWRRPALAAGLAVALAAAVLAGSQLGGDNLPGSLELDATLTGAQGQRASAVVQKTGIGRVIEFRTGALPILPKGEYYELWFVGPGDRPAEPNRISAGTFHPDEKGRSDVRFAAAVDPAKYPRLAVTAEPGDGNPAPSGPDVLRSPKP